MTLPPGHNQPLMTREGTVGDEDVGRDGVDILRHPGEDVVQDRGVELGRVGEGKLGDAVMGDGAGDGIDIAVEVVADVVAIAQCGFQASAESAAQFQHDDAVGQGSVEEGGMNGRGVERQGGEVVGGRVGRSSGVVG